jgi:hypothetical protein
VLGRKVTIVRQQISASFRRHRRKKPDRDHWQEKKIGNQFSKARLGLIFFVLVDCSSWSQDWQHFFSFYFAKYWPRSRH